MNALALARRDNVFGEVLEQAAAHGDVVICRSTAGGQTSGEGQRVDRPKIMRISVERYTIELVCGPCPQGNETGTSLALVEVDL